MCPVMFLSHNDSSLVLSALPVAVTEESPDSLQPLTGPSQYESQRSKLTDPLKLLHSPGYHTQERI